MFPCPTCYRVFFNRQGIGSHQQHCTSLHSNGHFEQEENEPFEKAWDDIQVSAIEHEEREDSDEDSQMWGSEFHSSIGDDDERHDSDDDSYDFSHLATRHFY